MDKLKTSLWTEALQYSFQDYIQKCVIPHYQRHGLPSGTALTPMRPPAPKPEPTPKK
jgi:hypothetical protein